jgi:hypothetical protein
VYGVGGIKKFMCFQMDTYSKFFKATYILADEFCKLGNFIQCNLGVKRAQKREKACKNNTYTTLCQSPLISKSIGVFGVNRASVGDFSKS